MKRVLLILAATVGLTVGGLLPTNSADAQIGLRGALGVPSVAVGNGRGYYGYRGYNRPYYAGYYGYQPYYRSYYRPYASYSYGYPRYYSGYYGYPGYSSYGYPGYSSYPSYYGYPSYSYGQAYYGPSAGVYFR